MRLIVLATFGPRTVTLPDEPRRKPGHADGDPRLLRRRLRRARGYGAEQRSDEYDKTEDPRTGKHHACKYRSGPRVP